MNTEIGCGFCQRNKGLPVFLARPAIMEKSDGLPRLHYRHYASFPVGDAGGARYTARILREGFLYVYYEKSNQWETYTISSKGHYYLHPEEGSSQQCLNSEQKTVCMNNGSKIARASFITLYIMPEEKENGIVWFAWSDAPWSEEMKKQHEDKEHRIKNMQSFNVDVWLTSGTHENVDFLSELKNTVAEYHNNFSKTILERECPITQESFDRVIKETSNPNSDYAYFKTKIDEKAGNIIVEANELNKKGIILFLSDPVGMVKEISLLCNYLVGDKFKSDQKYARGLALSSMLSGLKKNVCNDIRERIEKKDSSFEDMITDNAGNNRLLINIPGREDFLKKQKKIVLTENIKSLDERVESAWNDEYEIYIDRKKEKEFIDEYNNDLKLYIENTVSPMVDMHLKWLDSDVLRNKLLHHYDKKNNACSLLYVQAVNDCVYGMTDKKETIDYIVNKLEKEKISRDNFILRAIFRNDDVVINKLNIAVNGAFDYASLPWNKIFDGVTDTISKYFDTIDNLEVYLNTIVGAFTKLLNKGANDVPKLAVIGYGLSCGQAVGFFECKGKYKDLVHAFVNQSAKHLGMESRSNRSRLYTYADKIISKMNLDDVKMEQTGKIRVLSLFDPEIAKSLAPLPMDEKMKRLSKVFKSEKEIREELFEQQYKKQIVPRDEEYRGMVQDIQEYNKNESVQSKLKNWQFTGCSASLAFQTYALFATYDEIAKNFENRSKFFANLVGAVGTAADWTDRFLSQLKNQRLVVKLVGEGRLKVFSNGLKFAARVCAVAAIVSAAWDIYHAYEESQKENMDMGLIIAYGVSGLSTLGLTVAAVVSVSTTTLVATSVAWMLLGPVAIAVYTVALFSAAIYISIKKRQEVKEWLLSCMWRKIPEGEEGIPPIWATAEQEKKGFKDLMQLTS
ncbi:hypothetical protein Xsto_00599 [Xenorhabdus stockiae]|uniref:Toxin VasX N-terminal region domain-containing protein n=1 Tax=Xenorhabdus stockiae TaxID=351614 RepID=A0A2D0KUP3_9GAMM|nr:T6SS effector BTH_I2691 family protein [Xenorhabdus stockiae]PHM66947.1 hypothetical protein Xsto_00599 [Xenorhabdus stockiae]